MPQSPDDVIDELRNYVAGRGHEANFLYDKLYSRKSYIKCIDFSPWVRKKLLENDIFALAVFKAQGGNNPDIDVHPAFKNQTPFKEGIERMEIEIKHLQSFPFEEYFTGEVELAKTDLKISYLSRYRYQALSRIFMAYRLSLIHEERYFKEYNKIKKTNIDLPNNIEINPKFTIFQHELRKLPFATRLHLFDILEYSTFETKKEKLKYLNLKQEQKNRYFLR